MPGTGAPGSIWGEKPDLGVKVDFWEKYFFGPQKVQFRAYRPSRGPKIDFSKNAILGVLSAQNGFPTPKTA